MGALLDVPGLNVYIIGISIVIFSGITIGCLKEKERTREHMIYIVLLHSVGISGFGSMSSGVVHLAYSKQIAESIGWPESPFHMEVAFANLAFGSIGYAVYWFYEWIPPAIVTRTIFLWGAGITHIIEYSKNDNTSGNNVGPVLFWDFLNPSICIILFILHKKYLFIPQREHVRRRAMQNKDREHVSDEVNDVQIGTDQ
eukprot:1060874_1